MLWTLPLYQLSILLLSSSFFFSTNNIDGWPAFFILISVAICLSVFWFPSIPYWHLFRHRRSFHYKFRNMVHWIADNLVQLDWNIVLLKAKILWSQMCKRKRKNGEISLVCPKAIADSQRQQRAIEATKKATQQLKKLEKIKK